MGTRWYRKDADAAGHHKVMAVLKRSQSEPTDRLVLAAIAAHADATGDNAFPGSAALEACTGLSGRQVYRSIARLVERGELERLKPTTGRGHAQGYRILIPTGKGDTPVTHRDVKDDPPVIHTPERVTPPSPIEAPAAPGKGDSQSVPKGDHSFSETSMGTTPPLPPHDQPTIPGASPSARPSPHPSRPKTRKLRWNRKTITIPVTDDADALAVFDRWSAAQQASGRRGPFKLTAERRDAIDYALSELPRADVCDAAEGWLHDDWPDRPKHSDLPVLFRTVGHIERWRDLYRDGPPRASPRTNGHRRTVFDHARRRYEEALAAEAAATDEGSQPP